MRIWFACFLVLFAIAELLDWVQHLQLPLPIYILGGAFLAIASNYNKLASLWREPSAPPPPVMPSVNPPSLSQSTSVAQPIAPISFTIILQPNQPDGKQ